MNNNDQSFSDNDMEKVLKNHARISSDSRKRIAGRLFEKLEEKKAEANAESPSKAGSHHIAWRIALAASIILVSGLMLFSAYDRHPEMATVVEFWNNCKIIRGSHELAKIEVGTKLKAGDLLITGPDSGMHIQTGDGSLVSMGRCSELECSAPRGSGRHTFNLHCGSILAKVAHDAKRLFSVKTPDALLKVIGTEFEAKVSGGVPSQNKENDKMKSSAFKKAATLTALTVLTGAVAVTPSNASETVVKSGSTASITASGGTTVDPVKTRSFINSIIKGNYDKNSSIWMGVGIGRKGLFSSIYRFNTDTGKADKVADIAGGARVESRFGGGALLRVYGMLLSNFTVDNGSGCPLVSNRLIMIANNGECLNLEFLAKYWPREPVFSPDGSKLAYIGYEYGQGVAEPVGGLYVLDFRTMVVKLVLPGHLVTRPAWAPDSLKILISKSENNNSKHKIVIIDADSGQVVDTNCNGSVRNCELSADGKRIAYTGIESLFVADYPGGKPVKLDFAKGSLMIMPSFSPDSRYLAYSNYTAARIDEIHVIDLNTNDNKLVCSIPSKGKAVEILKWTDNARLSLCVSDYVSATVILKQIELSGSPAVIKDIELNTKPDADSAKAITELGAVVQLYLNGMRSCALNRLDEGSRNYKEAYVALLKFYDSAKNIDPSLKLESVAPYLELFKKSADMTERELYLKELKKRLELASFIDSYVYKNKRPPDSMEEYAKFFTSSTGTYNSIKANSPEGKFAMRMPDEKRDVITSFELKKIGDKNIEIWSAPLPWGGRLKVRFELKKGRWEPKGEAETVPAP